METTFTQIPLDIHQRLALEANPISITELADGGYLLNFNKDPHVIRLDKHLRQIWKKDLQAQTADYVNCIVTASPDGQQMAIAGKDNIRLFDMDGQLEWVFPHEAWNSFLGSSCTFSADGQLIWFIVPASSAMENDILYAVRRKDYKVQDTWMMDGNQEFNYTIHPAPDQESVLISAAAGQDSCLLFKASLNDSKIECILLNQATDRIMGSFTPDGSEFVTAPHYDDGIIVYNYPDCQPVATVTQSEIFNGRDEYPCEEDCDNLDYVVEYISNKTLLAFSRFGRLLLIDRQHMQCIGELLPEQCEIRAYDLAGRPTTDPAKVIDYAGEVVTVCVNKQQQLVMTHNAGEVRLYNLPEELF
ncbi:WD40 repeat domain-containing protein [Chitinophaga rhizophila]|uniref:WD40 repeat domain-containing protein n=1 Tax=Chitinophaga rhizophila TaxID=2866212 RepID=A0ABS7GK56_9BACT|nr:WD40 repeat domain-containing protein [Chitinophaga rhizophila]MBW8687570.1 WD40 repeat domain-containing protein [Chitinophaga rhizophila]